MKNFNYFNLNQIKSNPDGQPTVNRQSRLMSHQGYLRNLAMIFAVLVMSIANIGMAWGQTTIYNTGWEGGIGTWGTEGLAMSEETTNVRTGSKAVKGSYTGSSSAKCATQSTGTTTTSSKSVYCHIIGWAKSANGTMKAQIGFNSSKKGSAVTLSTSSWTPIKYVGSEINASTIILYKQGNGSSDKYDVYFDDVVSYYSSSNTTDVTAPSAATSASATTSSISWTNGTDSGTGATGRQTTSIWRRTDGSSDDLTLNAQGIYAVSATDQSGHWTCVSATVAKGTDAATSSYEGTFSGGDRYAIVHRDLAYNYSTPTYVTITADAGSGWGIAGSMNSWTAATNEMTGSGTVSTTISLSANTQYEFKVVDISSDTWYGNGGTIKGGITDWLFETGKGNTYLRTSCAGDYTFTFNTSTKRLSITYPNSHKVYFDKDGASWSNIYAYCYNDGDWNIGWPGIEITSNTEDHCGTEYYAYTNGYTYIIFNNGSDGVGNQTGNITVAGYEGKHAVGAAATGWSAYTTYTITYAANGGGSSMTSETGICPNGSRTLTSNAFTAPSGCASFSHWTANVAVTANGNAVAAGGAIADGATLSNINSDIALTAVWKLSAPTITKTPLYNTFTISGSMAGSSYKYSTDGTTPTNAYSSAVAFDAAITAKAIATKSGYADSDVASLECSYINCSISTCGNATLTYTINGSTSVNNTAANLLSEDPDVSNPAALETPVAASAVTLSTMEFDGNAGKAVAKANGCYTTSLIMSSKLSVHNGSSFNTSHYLQFAFTVKEGYTFTPCDIQFVVQPTSYATDFRWEVTDGTSTYGYGTASGVGTGSDAGATVLTGITSPSAMGAGTYYIRLYPKFKKDNKTNYFRIADNVILKGTTAAAACTAPTTVNVTATVNEVSGYWFYPGDDVVLTAAPTGSPAGSPVTYQWKKNGSNVGTNSATLTIDDAAASDAGKYTCTISYGACSTTSAEFSLKCMQFYLKDSEGADISNHALVKEDATHATLSLSLTGGTTYKFRVTDGCNDWYGNTGEMTSSNCTDWAMDADADCRITTNSTTGEYTFNFDFSEGILGTEMKVSVVYPGGDQEAGKIIYWDNSVLNWAAGKQWYRIGKKTNNTTTQMTLVPGTANLYKVTTAEYNGFQNWHIANNDGNGTGNIFWTKGDEEHAITHAMAFEGTAVSTAAITVTPSAVSPSQGTTSDNDNCYFYSYTKTNGMKTDRVTISPYSNGTITINYTNTSGSAATLTSGSADLAHTVILSSITAVPATGYQASAITINEGAYSANYVVTGPTTIAASFTATNYTIAYDLAGGSVASPNPTSYTIESEAITLNNPTKTGYTFAGWTGTGLAEATTTVTIAAGSTGNRSYTATWSSTAPTISSQPSNVSCNVGDERSISVTASISTGGTPTYQWQVSDNGSDWANVASSGTSASYTVPTASAGTKYYRCVVTNPNGSATTTSDAATVTVTAVVSTTYYLVTSTAQLNTTDTYIIANSTGTAIMSTTTADTNKNPDDITSGFSVDGSTLTVTSASPNLFKLTSGTYGWLFRGGNGSGNYISSDGTPDADLWYNTSDIPTKNTGEWNVSLAGGIATMKLGKAASTTYHIYYNGSKFLQATTASNIRLYTSNSTPVYTVTYDLNGGEGTLPTNRPEKSGTEITLASSTGLTKDGFTFDGWLCSVNLTKYAAGASYTMTAANTTFTAQWVEAAAPTLYTVTFNSNGGSSVSPIEQGSAGASITMPAAPTYASHTFQGWVIGGNTYAAGASYTPEANVTAYATWKANCAGGGSGSTEVYNGENVAKGNTTASGWTINNSSNMTLTSGSSDGYSYWYLASSSTNYVQFDGSASLVAGDQIKIQWTHTVANKDLTLTINGSGASLTSGGHVTTANTKMEAVYDVTSAKTVTSIKLNSSGSGGCKIYQVTIVKASGGGCCYVTYNGNGAESGCISDKTAYTADEGDVTILGNTGVSAYVKLGYRFNGWNTAANGSGKAYAAGDVVENISNDLTLYAQWVLDACSAPAAPAISGTASRTVGQTIELTATCASGADGSTTYTWYKGVDWATASAASPVQDAMTAGAGGRTFTKASCVAGDAGTYWCKASNGTGCEAHNETGFTVTVSDAVGDEHIYYYKDANHYSDGTYSDPEGNTASSGDNKSLSSPWTICSGCKAGVDSVVAYGATYDGKGNHMNAYIKLPTGGNATTKNITFALTAGYTGTLTMKIGGYENNPTVTLQPLVAGVLGDAIDYSGTVSGVATTENPGGGTGEGSFGEITWDLSTAGGTYVLTVTSKTGYISQIDMTTETSAKFNVTYDGNGKTGGDVPTDDTDYEANESVTVQAQGTMEKANYTFGGWNTANNGTGTNYVAGSGTFSIKGATTLYAHWTQTINLAPGAKGTGSLGATVSWNGTAVRGFTAHTAAGYSLTGYYTETSGGTKVLNADGSFAATNIDGFITDSKWSRTGAAATLYAQWSGSAIVTNTLNVGSKTWGSSITTTAPLQITDLSALAGQGGIKVGEATDDQAAAGTPGSGVGKGSLSPKVEANSGESKNAGEYMELGFTVAPGYRLRVTGLSVIVRSVSNDGKYDAILSDGTNSIEVTGVNVAESLSSGANLFTSSYNTTFEGDVTLKIWGYSKSSGKAMTTYRYATPIAIYGAVEESCTPPTFSGLDYSATEYTQGNPASAISVTGAANEDSYHWKYSTVNDRTSGIECGTGSSVTPSTESTGTLYYWCELENTCTTVKTPTVAITVSASASDPTVTWSSVSPATVNYGGGNYTLRATVNETNWSGTLESSMVTAPAGIYIHNIGIGKDGSNRKYIEFQFDVTTAFDREANETIGFHLSLPAISGTPNWNALTSDKLVTYEACEEGEGAAGQVAIPLTATAQTSATNPQNYWEVAEAGWLAFNYGSAVSVLPAATAYRTSEVDFGYYVATTNKKKWMFQPYIAGVNKVRVAFRAAGNLSSGQASVSKFYYDTEYFASPGSHENLIGDVSASQATYTSGENGYIEFTVPEMAANSYGAFELENSSIEIYGIVLFSENTGSGGTIPTNPTWSGGLNKDGSSEVDKNQGDPNFTYTISTTTNTLGGITYSSSNPSVAEVNTTTGEVRITATGNAEQTAVITATLARSGCYQPATRTYTVRVAGQECTITSAGTLTADKTSKCESDNVVLSLSGHDTDGTTVTWYRDETDVTSSVSNNTLTTSTPGAYSVVVSKSGCSLRSNTVNVTNISAATSATKIVDRWYVKNGRLTPDIALWRLDEGTTFTDVSWSPSNSTGLDFVIRDGIVYLEGKEPNVNSSSDIEYTLTLTITDACRTPHELTDKTITLIHQKNTDKHVLAFVVTGKEKGGFTESIPAAQTDKVALYNEIAKNFDVQATNIYSTDDEQKIKEYYSQFDIICITDYPNTKTKGTHSVSYSDAIGVMVDIRPVLTMEAWVSGLSNWNKKGISGDPKSPTTRQYTMLLQCKDHEIFAGTKLTEVGEGDDKMYRIHMVDETQHPYDTLDANYGSGTHESKKGYRYGSYPALQGFTFSQAMEDADLLPLGLIDDGAGKDLQVGLERQHEMSARMMVLGINSTAMERLTADGERIVINALKYLMKKSAEEIADCSTSFVGGAEGDGESTNWMNAENWTGNTVPDKTQKVRILAPCVVPAGEKAHVAGVLIAPNGKYNGEANSAEGSLTIAAGGALVVDGKIQSVTAPAYNRPRATTPADLAVLTSVDAQGALIFDNSEGEAQATVQMYSKASGAPYDCKWQWIATPFSNVNRAIEFYYGAWMYEWDNATHAWTQILNDDPMEPFKGYSITQEAAGSYWMNGVLASTESREQTLRSDEINGKNNGINVIGNSWTAPIQIANFEAEDFTNAHATIFILNTGLDEEGTGEVGTNNSTAGQYISIPVEASELMESTLKVIPAMQAFQVKAHVGGGSLNMDYDRLVRKGAMSQEQIDESMRAPRRQIRRAARINKAEVEKMHITIRGSRFQDEVYIFAHPDFTEGFDNGWDGEKIRGASEAVQLFVRDATSRWAVAAVPTFVGTYLATYKGEDNEYTISFDYSGDETLYWYDTKTDIYTEINAENTYTYTTDVSTIQTRFMITNENPKLEVPTGVESEKTTNTKAVKFIDEDKMYIFVNGKLYDATGKVVK